MRDGILLAAYLLGPVALVAALADDGRDSERTFQLRQALALNLLFGAISAASYGFWAPGYIMETGLSGTTLAVLIGPLAVILAGLAYLGMQAAQGAGKRLPVLTAAITKTMGDRS